MSARRRCRAEVHVVDRSAHIVPVEASATVVFDVVDRRAWPRVARRGTRGAGLAPEAVATAALDGALRAGLASRPLEVIVTGAGRTALTGDVRQRVGHDLEPLGLVVLGLWLGEVGDPTGHLGHWVAVRQAVVGAAARVQMAMADRDAAVSEHGLAAQSWAAWWVAGLAREEAKAQVGAAAAPSLSAVVGAPS